MTSSVEHSRLSMRQLSASAISEAGQEPSGSCVFSPDFIEQLRSAVDELESSHHQADSVRGGASGRASPAPRLASDSFLSPQGGGPAGPQRGDGAQPRTGQPSRQIEKARAQRGLAAEVAAAAAAAAEEADFERWGYRSGYAGSGREEGPGSMGSTSRSGKARGAETARRTALTLEEHMLHDVDVRGMKALMAMQVTSDNLMVQVLTCQELRCLRACCRVPRRLTPPSPAPASGMRRAHPCRADAEKFAAAQ